VLQVQCNGCGTSTIVDCSCPPELANMPFHIDTCAVKDLDAQLTCKPSATCCTDDHGGMSHGTRASQCPLRDGGHAGQPCPTPAACGMWTGMVRDVAALNPDNPDHMAVRARLEQQYGQPVEGDCPGGHCALGVPGCWVCRPVTITWLGGGILRPAPAAVAG
jgi:hypothetical protein